MKYRLKPVEIEAVSWTRETEKEAMEFLGNTDNYGCLNIKTKNGYKFVADGDYIVKDANGDFYPCKPDIFEERYETVG